MIIDPEMSKCKLAERGTGNKIAGGKEVNDVLLSFMYKSLLLRPAKLELEMLFRRYPVKT